MLKLNTINRHQHASTMYKYMRRCEWNMGCLHAYTILYVLSDSSKPSFCQEKMFLFFVLSAKTGLCRKELVCNKFVCGMQSDWSLQLRAFSVKSYLTVSLHLISLFVRGSWTFLRQLANGTNTVWLDLRITFVKVMKCNIHHDSWMLEHTIMSTWWPAWSWTCNLPYCSSDTAHCEQC